VERMPVSLISQPIVPSCDAHLPHNDNQNQWAVGLKLFTGWRGTLGPLETSGRNNMALCHAGITCVKAWLPLIEE
jgi:hypothetical protein